MSAFTNQVALKRVLIFIFFACIAFSGFKIYKNSEKLSLWFAIQNTKPRWVVQQIESDLSCFSTIRQQNLDETFEKAKEYQVVRYRIINGTIYRQGKDHGLGRTKQFEKMLRRIHRSKKLPNVDFLVCLGDGVPESYVPQDFWITEQQAPLLAWAKKKSAPFVVLIPDVLTTKEGSWHKEIETVNQKYREVPWMMRKEVAFWRGSSNDKGYTLKNFKEKPRFQISLLSKKHPHQLDAGYCRVFPKSVEAAIQDLGLIAGFEDLEGHLSYKYLPVLDGHMCTFPGFQWRLLSGSLTLKQESDEVQYFYGALEPYEHYIPVKRDMSDLIEKIDWAKKHDSECHLIAERARAFAHQNLMPNQIYAYLYWVLVKYNERQDFDLTALSLGPQWQELDR